jgi:type VI secretion system secreted protein VgrG
MDLAQLWLESGESSLSVRHFRVEEQMSGLFRARVMARSPDEGIELGSLVGRAASLRLVNGLGPAAQERLFSGVCVDARMARAEGSSEGLSTYELTLVPSLWLLTQRRQNRLFQHISVPDIIDRLLREWGIEPEWRIDRGSFPPLELRVQ